MATGTEGRGAGSSTRNRTKKTQTNKRAKNAVVLPSNHRLRSQNHTTKVKHRQTYRAGKRSHGWEEGGRPCLFFSSERRKKNKKWRANNAHAAFAAGFGAQSRRKQIKRNRLGGWREEAARKRQGRRLGVRRRRRDAARRETKTGAKIRGPGSTQAVFGSQVSGPPQHLARWPWAIGSLAPRRQSPSLHSPGKSRGWCGCSCQVRRPAKGARSVAPREGIKESRVEQVSPGGQPGDKGGEQGERNGRDQGKAKNRAVVQENCEPADATPGHGAAQTPGLGGRRNLYHRGSAALLTLKSRRGGSAPIKIKSWEVSGFFKKKK